MENHPYEVVREANPNNEEVASLSIEIEDGKVVVNFGDGGLWLGSCHLSTVDAKGFASALQFYADKADS